MEIRPGRRLLGRYTILERVGFGGMGEVWRACRDADGMDVAVKVLARHLVSHAGSRERFRSEARHAGSLSHPHVVSLHEAELEDETMVLVMELVDGGSLAERLDGRERLPLGEALRITRETLSGLAAAHEAGLVHRDVKPGNVLFTRDDKVKLSDFGIARLATGDTSRTAEIYGSTPYLAPERADGHPAVPASDVYAVGCVLFEMLTGMSPFTGETPAVTVARHLQYQPPAPSVVDPVVPAAVDAVVMRALAKDPVDRYPDAGAMLVDLEHAEATGAVSVATVRQLRRLTWRERRRFRRDPVALLPVEAPRNR